MRNVTLITGVSCGIGAAIALFAVEHGYVVVLNYLCSREATEALCQCIERQGSEALVVVADVAEEDDVEQLFAATDERFGRLDVLVNSAGALEAQTRLENTDAARSYKALMTNVIGGFLCVREAVKRLSTHHGERGGNIVNVPSMASRLGSSNEYIDYTAAKGAIDSTTIELAREVAAEGIRVNAVQPGLIDTEIHASGDEPGRIEHLKGDVPLERGGTTEEAARVIL